MFKNLAVLIAYTVSLKANPFALMLARACKSILYLWRDIAYRIVKWVEFYNA